MLYRRASREVEAIRFDGSERAARDISVMKGAATTILRGEIEVATTFGRKIIRAGQWITRDRATGAMRVYDHDDFLVEHERVEHV